VSGVRGVVLTVRFLCELSLLAALASWGLSVGNGVTAWLLGIGAPLLAAIVWGALVAPKARWPQPLQVRLVIELLLFAAAAGALAVAGSAGAGPDPGRRGAGHLAAQRGAGASIESRRSTPVTALTRRSPAGEGERLRASTWRLTAVQRRSRMLNPGTCWGRCR
jgi:hypothetical protein